MDVEKTPVTILQEMMIKMGKTPRYELCENKFSNTTSQWFTYKVTCDGAEASGTGRSKKDAKHNAATAMLGKLRSSKVTAQSFTAQSDDCVQIVKILRASNSASSSSDSFTDNHSQELIRLCSKYNLQEPVYKELDTSGPPHSRVYTAQCLIANNTVSGTGKSKKQAKNNAAKCMVDHVKDMFCADNSSSTIGNKKLKTYNTHEASKNIQSEDEALKESAKLKINYDLKMESERKELRKNLRKLLPNPLLKLENLAKLVKECQENINDENITKVKQEFQMLLQSAKIDFHHMLLQSMTSETFMLIIQLNTDPEILEMSIGSSREEAEMRTINKVIETLKVFLV